MATTTRHFTLLPHELIDDLTDADAIHKQTMALYASTDLPGEPGARRSGANILWRHEASGIAVSADLPATDVPEGARGMVHTSEVTEGDDIVFSVTVDAVVRVRGRDIPAPDATTWFERKLDDVLGGITIHQVRRRLVKRRNNPLEQVSIVGTATVVDAPSLARLLRVGVGRSKTFGCGLLTVRALS